MVIKPLGYNMSYCPFMSIFTFVCVCNMLEYAQKVLTHYNINSLPSNVCLPGVKESVHHRGHQSKTIIVKKFVPTILLTINSIFTHLMLASVFVEHRQTMQIQTRRRRMWRFIGSILFAYSMFYQI